MMEKLSFRNFETIDGFLLPSFDTRRTRREREKERELEKKDGNANRREGAIRERETMLGRDDPAWNAEVR